MGLDALKSKSVDIHSAAGTTSRFRSIRGKIAAREIILLSIFLSVLQAADGVLTAIGVEYFGLRMEGNVLLRSAMESFGHIEALALVKLFSISFVIGLAFLHKKVRWVKNALGLICCIYIFAAIIPWTYYISKHLL